MPKRKTFDGRKQREKQKIRMRQKRQQSQYPDTPPIELVVESNVSVERMDGAISAPPSNFLGQVSMGFPHSKKPLARVQASCSERMHSPAPRLPSPRGSRLFVREQDKAPSPDSPAWVCAPPRAPGPDTVHVSGSAGQAQLDTSREEETSSMLKDEETLTRNKTDTERKTKHILNEHKILETIYENQNNDISQDIYDYQNNEKLKNVIENQCIKISENMYDNHNEISRNLYENDVTENINENCVNAIDVILYQNEETRTKKDVSDKIEYENDLEASKNDGRGRKRSIDGMVNENGKSTRILLADLGQVYMHLHSLAFSMGYSENVLCNLTGVYCKISGMTDTESEFEPFATTAGTEGESEGNDEELQNDDLMIICSEIKGFTFNPLNEGVKRNLCEELNVPLMCTENVGIAQDVGKELTSPETEKEIIGDGNCFFRAVSFSVSNSEDFYNTIRSAVCAHMMANQELFKTFLRNGQESIESHLSASLMTQEGTWATELEILAMAHFLRVDIFTYSGGRWLKFSGDMVTKCLNKRRGAIYLHHLHQNHYNVVISMHVDCDSNETVLMRGETRENIMQRRNIGKSSSRLTCYQRRKNIQKEKYKQNPELRSRKLAAAALKYKEHKSYQLSVKEKYREKYRSDTKYRDRSKKLYDKVRDVKKEISKKKYRYNYAHRDDLKRRSSIKYNTDTAHREDLKTRSTEKYRRNSLHREDVKLRSKDKYRTDPLHKVDVKMRSTEKYRTDPLHKEEIKKRSTVKYQTNAKHREEMKKRSIAKYQSDEKHRENVKNRSKQIYKSDEAHRKRVNSASTRRYNTDESYRKRNLRKRSMKYETDEAFRSKAKVYSKEMYASSTCVRLKKKDEVIQQRRAKRQKLENEKEVANLFKCKVKEGIDYICCCCNRLLFENQVQRCNPNTYEKNTEAALAAEVCIQKKYFHQCSEDCLSNCTKSSLWICFTCHRKILRGKIPAEATVNNLFLEDIPKELCDLNCLEKHLIALQIPFMKVMGLPHGGQKNVHGPVVCVPSDMKKVASLPLKEDENLLLRVKLKRKLNYKGYFEYQFVDPKHVFAALDYLKQNNKWYTNVTIDTNWKENDYDEVTDVTDEIKLDDVENQEVATDTCLQPLDIAQEVLDHYFDDIYNIAPGEEHRWNDAIRTILQQQNDHRDPDLLDWSEKNEVLKKYRVLAKSQVPKTPNENVFELLNSKGFIQKRTRTKPAVIRYPRFNVDKMSEKYYQCLLQLFLPHERGSQLKPPGFDLYQTFYENGHVKIANDHNLQAVKLLVDRNHAKFAENEEIIANAQETFETIGEPQDAWASLCPETELIRKECMEERSKLNVLNDNVDEIPDMETEANSADVMFKVQQNNQSREEAMQIIQNLNETQRSIFYYVRDWCLEKSTGQNPDPFHIFITGGAGTGKSHVIKAIHYEASRLLAKNMSTPDSLAVLLTAFTGTAAFNIGGNTIHHLFSLPKYMRLPYEPLKEQTLSELRIQLRDLNVLVIDEVSMVYKRLLYYIHERLVQIKKSKEPFGGVSVIAVGDFYQLPPVKQRKDERLYKDNISYPVDHWQELFKVVELSEIMRQKQDVPFAEVLNSLRTRELQEPLNTETLSMLRECVRQGPEDVLHVYATNDEVNNYNLKMLRKSCNDFVEIDAQDFEKNTATGKLTLRKKPISRSKSDGLSSSLLIAPNARSSRPTPSSSRQHRRRVVLEDRDEADLTEVRETFTDYVTEQWVNGDRLIWNHFGTNGPRTNNNLKAWHGKLKRMALHAHPNIYTVIKIFKDIQNGKEILQIQKQRSTRTSRGDCRP
ncbi:uncharacterized protein [Magallana gigas]|uniref:uncharacterized protein n=1 Tax=Magallana gigas TaxID=29159 RepID=UPI0033411028